MKCPWCEQDHPPRTLHAHLTDAHADAVRTYGREERQFYQVRCPYCGAEYTQRIKKASGDEGFVVEFERQIRMVAFDMLINHVLAEHEAQPEHEPAGG